MELPLLQSPRSVIGPTLGGGASFCQLEAKDEDRDNSGPRDYSLGGASRSTSDYPHLHLCWNKYPSSLHNYVRDINPAQANEGFLTDLTISCKGDVKFKAHRVVVAASSKVLRDLLIPEVEDHLPSDDHLAKTIVQWVVAQQSVLAQPLVCLPDVDYEVMELLLTYMYEGEVQVPSHHILPLVEAAQLLRVHGLLDPPVSQSLTSTRGTSSSTAGLSIMQNKVVDNNCMDVRRLISSQSTGCVVSEAHTLAGDGLVDLDRVAKQELPANPLDLEVKKRPTNVGEKFDGHNTLVAMPERPRKDRYDGAVSANALRSSRREPSPNHQVVGADSTGDNDEGANSPPPTLDITSLLSRLSYGALMAPLASHIPLAAVDSVRQDASIAPTATGHSSGSSSSLAASPISPPPTGLAAPLPPALPPPVCLASVLQSSLAAMVAAQSLLPAPTPLTSSQEVTVGQSQISGIKQPESQSEQLPSRGLKISQSRRKSRSPRLSSSSWYPPTEDPARPFACSICPKRFRMKHHLKEHNLIHSGEMPFSCHLCPKRFNRSYTLKNHMKLHSNGLEPPTIGNLQEDLSASSIAAAPLLSPPTFP